ncbi:hypothetical protein [Spirilliplanes yamanashiensis]|uniref:Uncharacterized protein n=1 Tax=Spirilliplanes yamanashiensis TaxID=42233 RepID=A0A8J4DIH2_9ACTN|nr:hypothetical protein [Spirilliplanes yamanashiensis]MDP9814717.1 hypothetical protein [Spirilliplanes yamanashiensis]GIJ02369.1 hypothetical protein Sya03_17210 [Spirilliplanes yamanashiensis]
MNRRRIVAAVVAAALVATGAAPAAADPTADPPADPRVDLAVLVVTDGGAATQAVAAHLTAQGVPHRTVRLDDPGRPAIDAAFLADADGANFQGVVLPNANPFADQAELAALHAFEARYGVRQVDAYLWPTPQVGLNYPAYSGPLDGTTAAATAEGLAGPFRYLRGHVPFEDNDPGLWESYGFLAQPLVDAPDTFTPLVTTVAPDGTAGVLAGVFGSGGREELAVTFAYNAAQQQFRLLAPGMVEWLTRGVHLGLHRNHLSVHVDDVFLGDARWHTGGNCTPGEDCTGGQTTADIRMTADDVAYAAQWQERSGFTLDLVYNGAGSDEAGPGDPLTAALLAARDRFRWTNHTYSHDFLGCVQDTTVVPWRCATGPDGAVRYATGAHIADQVARNRAWGLARGLPLVEGELVTGEHSGLRVLPQQPADNPDLAPALDTTQVRWLAADNSRQPAQRAVGGALTVPRHPLNVFFNVGTAAEETDEYNWIYTARADGGSGVCEDNPATVTCVPPLDPATGYAEVIVPLETRLALARILGNDPRPHYVHQSNLAEERILYPLLDSILGTYRSLLADNTPIVCARLADSGAELRRQARWADAVAAGTAHAYLQDGVVHVTAPDGVDVPLTVPEGSTVDGAAFGTAYAGSRSAWTTTARVFVP